MRLFDRHHISDIHDFFVLADPVKCRISVADMDTVDLFPSLKIQKLLIASPARERIAFQRFDLPIDNCLALIR